MSIASFYARSIDLAMCAGMFAFQRRHRLHANSRSELERYIREHAGLTRDAYYRGPTLECTGPSSSRALQWPSPIQTLFPENDHFYADLYPCRQGWTAPTVIFLHALMSASDRGYRRWAAAFNAQGWNACFVHLPYHYSRQPPGYRNGELAITADLVRTAEGLRQGVSELRQLMSVLRRWGCQAFGLWASSYGGWIGALLASVEADFRFVALLEPIVDVEHAIWTSPAGSALRRELRARGITHSLIEQHFHLTSPMHGMPLCDPSRVILLAGEWDLIARKEHIAALHERWRGSELLHVRQGHFGYRMMPRLWQHLASRDLLAAGAPGESIVPAQ